MATAERSSMENNSIDPSTQKNQVRRVMYLDFCHNIFSDRSCYKERLRACLVQVFQNTRTSF